MSNPFETSTISPITGAPCVAQQLDERRQMVKRFNLQQCRAAMKLSGLQLGVIHALERRIKQLHKENPPINPLERFAKKTEQPHE
ncbi:MAG: hypothetical protein WED00_05815 [Aquisalimonadaceae bacterium]